MVMKKRLIIVFFLSIYLSFYSSAQVVNESCKYKGNEGKYKLLWQARTIRGENTLLLHILIKPKNVNRDFLILLAKRIRSEYCNEKNVYVVIFDDRKLASDFHRTDYFLSKDKIIERGHYKLDRENGVELLEFSTKRGNPTTEIKVDLSDKNKK